MKKFSIAKYQKELAKIRRIRKADPNVYINFVICQNDRLAHKSPYANNNDYSKTYFNWKYQYEVFQSNNLIYFIGTPDHLFVESK